MAKNPALKKAQQKYASKLVTYPLKFNPERKDDNLALAKLKRVGNKKDYIRNLILKDIYENDMH